MPEIVHQLRRLYAESNDHALVFTAVLRHGVVLQGRCAAVNIRSSSSFKPGNILALQEQITGRVLAALTEASGIVRDLAKEKCPISTEETRPGGPHGDLQASITNTVTLEGQTPSAFVGTEIEYAPYVEFGTGIRGSASAGAGPYEYSSTWPGMPAQPFLRPALDESHDAILGAFRKQGFNVS